MLENELDRRETRRRGTFQYERGRKTRGIVSEIKRPERGKKFDEVGEFWDEEDNLDSGNESY